MKRIHMQQTLLLGMEEMCFDFIDLIINNEAIYSRVSANKNLKCPKEQDEVLLKNYNIRLFRQIIQNKIREEYFNERLQVYIKKAEEQIEMHKIAKKRKTRDLSPEEKEDLDEEVLSYSSCSESHSECQEDEEEKDKVDKKEE